MRHSPDFHRQIRRTRWRRRARFDFRMALVAVIFVGGVAGLRLGGEWRRPTDAAPALPESVDPWAESRRSAELLKGQEGPPPRIEITEGRGGASASGRVSARFGFCHSGGGTNCVVDGDTVWMQGERIRIADIDAPETHPPRCAEEAKLGSAATERLQALLNQGPVTLEIADRDTDRYGRKLRIISRDGRSLGAQLVDEGLARRWTGRRLPWC
ncbi:thermonuclease family protein [Sphingomonas sp. DG1-23]|uniref:thermonuclease family protein n=1 Tax=Sphingomonas sp. DG1-23 TaxID=3068316 RepID=UPI00273D5101|nr:thermonuclease family protein [Sphingomonas sp. DG1-23]MDP5280926.1 thermonuclease family protein [Sphingomonas sp. DG1-23]